MSSPPTAAPDVARRLTRLALALLDLTMEPAAACSGERFDLVVEALSDQLSDAASALLAEGCVAPFRAPRLPPVGSTAARRAQAALRRHVEDGHLPGNARSLSGCLDGLRAIRDDLADTLEAAPAQARPFLEDCVAALSRLIRVITVYRSNFTRIATLVTGSPASRTHAADAATRAERALLRCLDRCGDTRVLR